MSRSARAALGTALLALTAACTSGDPAPPQPSTPQFAPDTTMAALQESGTIRVGFKDDQPGLGYREAGDPTPQGFDIEIAKIIVDGLGLQPDQIQWVEVASFDREAQLQNGSVDIVVASYSISESRRAVVGQAGPYFVTGQQILVAADNTAISRPEDLAGTSVCSVTGSSSGEFVHEEYGAIPSAYNAYAPCVDALLDGKLDAVSTDGAILLGFLLEHPDDLKIVGEPFTTERYGIGYRHGDTAMCEFITETLLAAYKSGAWQTAYQETLGIEDVEPPPAPRPDPCVSDPVTSAAPSSG